jgi:hypothetical protein
MNYKLFKSLIIFSILLSSFILLNNCSFDDDTKIERAPFPEDLILKRERERRERQGDPEDDNFVTGLFDNVIGKDNSGAGGGAGISVNTFLWRACLDTLSFMPLLSADPFGGVIITDWHSISESSEEKYKVVAYILDKELRVDALKVSVFKKRKSQEGEWIDAKSSKILKNKVEDAILTKARKYKLQSLN